jgi:hypothetical protein
VRVRTLTAAVLSALAGSASFAAEPGGKPVLNKSGVKAVVAWGGRSAEVTFGGPGRPAVGVFDGATQFALDAARAADLQASFEAAKVAELPAKIGGTPGRSGRVGPADPPPLVGWVTVRDGTETVANANQLGGGHQSPELARFAAAVLGACESSAKAGVRATDLTDGLAKVASGAVGPHGLGLTYTCVPSFLDAGYSPGTGLTVADGVATARHWDGVRWGRAFRLTLTPADLTALAKALADKGLPAIPDETGAAVPTELLVTVLGTRKHLRATPETYHSHMNLLVERIQAKRAGLVADVGDDPLAPLRGVQEVLGQLFSRVVSEGRPVAD